MCNFNVISGFIIGGQVAYVALLISLGIAVVNAKSLFLAAANFFLMLALILACVGIAALFRSAVSELNKCLGGRCDATITPLANTLNGLVAMMGAMAVQLGAITIAAAVPFFGGAAVAAVITWSMSLTAGITAILSYMLSSATAFNNCQAATGAPSNKGAADAIKWLGIGTAVLIFIEIGLGFEYQFIPRGIESFPL